MKPPNTAAVLAVISSAIVAGIMAGLFYVPIPSDNRDLVLQLGSAVVTGWGVALSFYFGGTNAKSSIPQNAATVTAPLDANITVEKAEPETPPRKRDPWETAR